MRKTLICVCILAFTLTVSLTAHAQSNAACPTLTRQLSVGSTGSQVNLLQEFLKDQGLLSSAPTGRFGSLTKKAVMQFQKANSVTPNGIVGPKTRTAIAAACAVTEPVATKSSSSAPQSVQWSTKRINGGNAAAQEIVPITHTVKGTVSGLTGSGLVLQNNGADDLAISADGSFTFTTPIAEGNPYAVTVSQQPSGQICMVTHDTGVMGGSPVTNVSINCSAILVSITVTANNESLPTTITEPFTAIGHYADSSTADITNQVTWDTSDHAIATISNTGLATGVSAGTVQVNALLNGIFGSAQLTVTDAVLTAVAVSPTHTNLPVGINLHYGASGIFSDGSNVDITNQVVWNTSDHNIATIDSTGQATGIAIGTTQVSATLGSITGTTNVTITDATLLTIAVTPDNGNLPMRIHSQYTAIGTFSDASTMDITDQVTWSTTNPNVVTINSTGLATGVTPGTTQVNASLKSVTGNTSVTVTNAVLTSIAIFPGSSNLPRSINQQFTAFGTFSDSTVVDITHQVAWDMSNHTVASINRNGLGTGISVGTTQVYARLYGIGGITSLSVTTATLTSIAIAPLNPAVNRNATLQVSAIGTFSDGTSADITNQVTWTSTSNAIATVSNTNPKGTVTGVAGGASIIRAGFHAVTGSTVLHVGV